MAISRYIWAAFAAYLASRAWSGLSLPYPCFGTVQTIPSHKLPTPSKLEGQYAPNDVLKGVTKLFRGQLQAAEHVHPTKSGALHLADKFGNFFITQPDSGSQGGYGPLKKIAYLGPSRPLGHTEDAQGNVLFADSDKGLVMLEKGTNKVVVLTGQVSDDSPLDPGVVLNYANDVDIAQDGTVYLSTSSEIPVVPNKFGFHDTFSTFSLTMFQGSLTGRLISYNPKTRKTHALTGGFYYANGVAVSQDQSFVAVVETMTASVHKYWLKGPKQGQTEVLISSLPGFPDGISLSEDGNFWIAMVAPNQAFVHILPFRLLRWIFAWLPKITGLQPALKTFGMVIKVSPEGKVLEQLQDTNGSVITFISSVVEHKDRLFFGNVVGDYVSYLDRS